LLSWLLWLNWLWLALLGSSDTLVFVQVRVPADVVWHLEVGGRSVEIVSIAMAQVLSHMGLVHGLLHLNLLGHWIDQTKWVVEWIMELVVSVLFMNIVHDWVMGIVFVDNWIYEM